MFTACSELWVSFGAVLDLTVCTLRFVGPRINVSGRRRHANLSIAQAQIDRHFGYCCRTSGIADAITWIPIGREAATCSVPAGSERAAMAICSIASASWSSLSARACTSRSSVGNTNERVVRVRSAIPRRCSRR